MAKNPYRPGVGTRPPYLAGREQQIHRFRRLLEDYPEKRRNLRVAASLGGERFTKADLDATTSRSTGALAQSLIRLIADNLVYRDDHGVYAYTAPMFGDFMRRRHQRLDEDR